MTEKNQNSPNYRMSRAECARQLGLSGPTIDRMIAAGTIRAISLSRPGLKRGRVRIDETSVAAILRGDVDGAADRPKMEAAKKAAKDKVPA